jgi:putative membrane protein
MILAPESFPSLNASLNCASGALLVAGYLAIRNKWKNIHVACMLSALGVSAVFLVSYLYYHIAIKRGQETRFENQAPGAPAWMKYLYYAILLSHIVLAMTTVPLALITAYQGLRGQLARHVRIARWTLPIWFYVSVTGVVVYWMLYRLYATD